MSDAYGGYGGISRFNRDFLAGLASDPKSKEIVVFPRLTENPILETIPNKIKFHQNGNTSKSGYIKNLISYLLRDHKFDILICGHINLLPIAWPLAKIFSLPICLIIHGIDAWQPTKNRFANYFAQKTDYVVSVSKITLERFQGWAGSNQKKTWVLPNCVDLSQFSPGPKPPNLIERYGLSNKKVIMTLGRMPGLDRCKGFDEVIEILPGLLRKMPNLVYLIAGDGPDRERLHKKALDLGLDKQVVFTGMVSETEKTSHYCLADAFVMPSRGEGFGIVLLEAMSCGVPVVASMSDGGREALREGELGQLVDPADPEQLADAIRQALKMPRGVPKGLEYFSKNNFEHRAQKLVAEIINHSRAA